MIDRHKIKQDIYFYFWVGIVIYVSVSVLNIIHLYQWKGREPIDFLFHLLLFSVNLSIIAQVKEIKNWARNVFIIKFAFFAVAFYPLILLAESSSWVYSHHWPHGIFQRVANMCQLVYEIIFTLYLLRRSIRFIFVHGP